VLATIRLHCPDAQLYLDRERFAEARSGLLIWEAFVSAAAKGSSHVADARIAVEAFGRSQVLPSAVTADRPLSLAGAVAIWSGWLDDPGALHEPTFVVRAGALGEPGDAEPAHQLHECPSASRGDGYLVDLRT
jgi:hypothetical protein